VRKYIVAGPAAGLMMTGAMIATVPRIQVAPSRLLHRVTSSLAQPKRSSAQPKSGTSARVHGAAGTGGTTALEVAAPARQCGMKFILMNCVF